MKISTGRKDISGFGRRLARDERGATLIYVSLALTVFMGFAALVIDGSRLYTLDTEMQSAADALALAGAAELDGAPGAIDRATNAVDNLVQNYETFGDSATAITGYVARFLSGLPANDADPITDDLVLDPLDADSDGLARFIEVRLLQEAGEGAEDNTRSISVLFATAIGGGNTARAGAVAVAGFTQAVCKFTPLFICNPYENETGGDTLAYFTSKIEDPAERRRIIALKKSGSGASLFPGNFGFLESDLGPGAAELKNSLARVDPGTCFVRDGVETQTGSVNSARHAINTRFDVYEGNFNSVKNNSAFRPAQNVTKGYLAGGNACNAAPDETVPPVAMALPTDSMIATDGNRMGNGDWDGKFGDYWNINHPDWPTPPNGWSDANLPTRYDVYRWEVEENEIPDNSDSGGENGNAGLLPRCTGSTPTDDPDRRNIYAAVLNCNELDLTGGSGGTVPALAFIKMFITQPMTKLPGTGLTDEDDTLYVEMVDIVDPGVDAEVVHDMVQLYR
jgi:hypothetical protein